MSNLFDFIPGLHQHEDPPKVEEPKPEERKVVEETEFESLTRINAEIRSAHSNESDIPIHHEYWKNRQRLMALHKGLVK